MGKLKILLLLGISLYSTELFGQEKYRISGTIKDGLNDHFIQGALITIRETAFSALSMEGGAFTLENLYPDRFVLNINVSGYQSYQAQINLKSNLNLGVITLFPVGYENPEDMALHKTIRATNIAELFSRRPNFIGGNQVFGIPPEPKRLIGNYYLDPKWNKASILYYKDMKVVEGYFVRYNISSNNFEMRDEGTDLVSTIPGFRVQNIVWIDSEHNIPRYFVNGMDFKLDGSPISGFFEVLIDGKIPLLRRTEAVVKPSNYNQALMIGERNDKIIKRNVYYYLNDREINLIPKEKRKFYKIFGEYSSEIEQFVKDNAVNIRQPSGYFTIFTQYNSKFEGFESLIPQFIEN